jgi:hypothetical protein
MHAWLSTSFPSADTTVWRTFFQDLICIARMAKQTHNWTLTGLGPGA